MALLGSNTPAPPEGDRPVAKQGLFSGAMSADAKKTALLKPYLPGDLVGGSIPYIAGTEDEAIWNAASQACGTERVHFCYTINEGRCWYLATPSSAMSSHPDSWCPLAAALPGNSEYWDRETVYLYEQEGSAGALRWDGETGRMQVFLGASRTILPRIQSMEANFVTINAESANIVPWRSRALMQERLSRGLTRVLMFSGLGVAAIALLVWFGSFMLTNIMTPRLDKARETTTAATNKLMLDAAAALQSNTQAHLARIIELFNQIGSYGGILVRYEVTNGNQVEWEALIPSAVAPSQLNATAVKVENGRVRVRGTR